MTDNDNGALDALRHVLADMGSVLVAYSGGVDSALLLAVAHDVLGERAVGLTAISPTFPPEELAETRRFVSEIGARHVFVDSHELEREGYAKNAGDRCYFCKSELFELCRDRATALELRWVADGTLVDDLGGHRPGLVAASENEVRHPLVEAGLDKATVRRLAKRLDIRVWDKPAFACLGSRFPVGTRVTEPRLRSVQRVESYLRLVGLRQFRARWHALEGQPMVRLEVGTDELKMVLEPGVHAGLIDVAKAEGFAFVTLDLEGYQRGRLSHKLSG